MNRRLDTNTQIVILAGGKGTRLNSINKGLPKSLTPLLHVPIIEHQIRFCRSQGFVKFLLIVAYESEKIIEYFETHPIEGIEIKYFKEISPKGTGGALYASFSLLEEYFFVIYSDTYFTINFSNFINEFNSKLNNNNQFYGMIFVHPNNHPVDSDIVELNSKDELVAIHGYPHKKKNLRNLVNAAFYLLKKDLIVEIRDNFDKEAIFDIAKDIFPITIKKGLKIFGYRSSEYIKDMGTPNRLEKLEKILEKGKLRNLSPNIAKEVVFIDRDGCINEEKGRIVDEQDLTLIEGSAEAIRNFNNAALPVYCVTNQPVVARGDIDEKKLNSIHSKLDFILGEENAFLDDLFYCPHHPDKGFEGEIIKLKGKCDCRKPNPGLLFQSAKKHNINFSRSWIIGDMTTDISAGQKVGARSILIKTGYGGSDLKEKICPDYIFNNLKEASEWITINYQITRNNVLKHIDKLIKQKIILVSGLNHVGKSNYSRVMKEILEAMGFSCHLINTNKWQKSKNPIFSEDNSINNYDLPKIYDFIKKCIRKEFPIYHNYSINLGNNLSITDLNETIYGNSTIIIEGPPLSKIFQKVGDNAFKIFLSKPSHEREKSLESKIEYHKFSYQDKVTLLEKIKGEDQLITQNYLKYSDVLIE